MGTKECFPGEPVIAIGHSRATMRTLGCFPKPLGYLLVEFAHLNALPADDILEPTCDTMPHSILYLRRELVGRWTLTSALELFVLPTYRDVVVYAGKHRLLVTRQEIMGNILPIVDHYETCHND